jgi:tetratricopeptide (TPR) repeat protein
MGNKIHTPGDTQYARGQFKAALGAYQKSLDATKEPNSPQYCYLFTRIGDCYCELRKFDQSHKFYRECLQIQSSLLGEHHHSLSSTFKSIGLAYRKEKKYHDAIESLHKSITVYCTKFPPTHPALISTYLELASVYKEMLDFENALDFYNKALKIVNGSRNKKLFGTVHNGLGHVNLLMGDLVTAESHLKIALEIRMKLCGLKSLELAETFLILGILSMRNKETQIAVDLLRKAVEIRSESLGISHADTIYAERYLARALFEIGKVTESLEFNERVFQAYSRDSGNYKNDIVEILKYMSAAYKVLGRLQESQHASELMKKYDGPSTNLELPSARPGTIKLSYRLLG